MWQPLGQGGKDLLPVDVQHVVNVLIDLFSGLAKIQRETNVVGTKRGCVVSGKILEKSASSGKRLENPGKTLERLGTCITQLFEDVRGFRSIRKHAYILF